MMYSERRHFTPGLGYSVVPIVCFLTAATFVHQSTVTRASSASERAQSGIQTSNLVTLDDFSFDLGMAHTKGAPVGGMSTLLDSLVPQESIEGGPHQHRAIDDRIDPGVLGVPHFIGGKSAIGPRSNTAPLTTLGGLQSEPTGLEAGTASISLQPSRAFLEIGQIRDIEIRVEDADALFLYNLKLEFDPNILQVVDADLNAPGLQVTVGDFSDQDNLFVVRNNADNGTGTIELIVTETHPGDGTSGSGVLGSVSFKGLAGGRSGLRFTEVRLFQDGFPDQLILPHLATDGTATVGLLEPQSIHLPYLANGRQGQ